VDSLIAKGLPQSALTQVNLIYTRARQEKNEPQTLKALIYRIRLQEENKDDATIRMIADLEKESPTARQPARSILQSLQAELYWNYFQQHRYQLYNRTRTDNFQKDSIDTWSIDDFHKKIGALFLAALKEEQLLQAVQLSKYEPILIKGNTRVLRPTLFDLLAHRALDYFQSDERDLTRPAYAFEIEDPVVFSDAETFARHIFKTADSTSLHFKALQLFQRLIALHLPDARPDALLDIDIQRLIFVHNYAVPEDKDERYMNALARLTSRWDREPAAAQAWYLQALQHMQKARNYDPLQDTTGRYEYIKAKTICDKVLAEKDSSEGKTHCAVLLREILYKSITLKTEVVNVPGQSLRCLVEWRNIPRFYGRIVRFDHATRDNLNVYGDEFWTRLLQLPIQQSFSQTLPATGDYQTHRVEISIAPLPVGSYALIASDDSTFSLGQHAMAMTNFYNSRIAYINSGQDYFVLDREGGQPLPDAGIQVWTRQYDRKLSRDVLVKAETYRTDDHGHFHLERTNKKDMIMSALEVTTATDHLFQEGASQLFYRFPQEDTDTPLSRSEYEKKHLATYFFTDRSIYRPGQTIYFKGIVVTRDFDTRKARTMTRFSTKVILYDANENKVDSLTVTTNDFGSYHGSFKLPENLLNGEFKVMDDSTQDERSFRVEEYKRPLFDVTYDTLKGSYRLEDSVRVQGIAKAYAGNAIDGATVKYRVVRQTRYPFCFYCRPFPSSPSQEITNGTIQTDAQGKFKIVFKALADRNVNPSTDPVFQYKVYADVTDINGETHSAEKELEIGYKALVLNIDIPGDRSLPADSLRYLKVSASNLGGVPEPAFVNVTMYALKSPDRLIRARYWEEPDQFILAREEYVRQFPHDEYSNDARIDKWGMGEKILETMDSAGRDLPIGRALSPGGYKVIVQSKDKYGQSVTATRYIELYDRKTGTPATPQYLWSSNGSSTAQPGENGTVDIGSSAGNVHIIRQLQRIEDTDHGNQKQFSFLELSKARKSTTFSVTEADRGGFGVLDVFVKDNRIFKKTSTIQVPWTNKTLDIRYETFRDKVLPGSAEKWKISISGQHADKVAAEVVAGMYDASLDQFEEHRWSIPPIYPTYDPTSDWSDGPGFTISPSQIRYIREKPYPAFDKRYDALISLSGEGLILNRRVYSFGVAAPGEATKANSLRDDALVSRNLQHDMNPEVRVEGSDMYLHAEKMKKVSANGYFDLDAVPPPPPPDQSPVSPEPGVQIRKNFNETAFFFPDLRTDDSGSVSFSFTVPEALTRWKGMILAHTKDLAFGYSEKSIVTQKQLMVQPNLPRFLREGDRMELGVKVVNLSDSEMTGQIELQLTDPTTGQTADGIFSNRQANQYFTVAAGQSTVAGFPIDIPYQYNKPLTYRIIARSKTYSDGEEATLPVVSNRMLVTESLPLNMPGDGTKEFHFEKLLHSDNSETLNHHALTVEFTSNPAWYAVQALPYLMEYPYECAEQTFNRFYANALAATIIHSSPRIQAIFEKWRTSDTAALLSNLEKNQELKSILLQETPWVLQGKSESQQKQHIALLFDMVRMSRELESSLTKIQQMQSPNGGFVWFKGGPDDRYITQYILTGIGRLQRLNAIPSTMTGKVQDIVKAALPYLDGKIKKDYENVNRKLPHTLIDGLSIGYLYMRSFFPQYGIPGGTLPAISYFRKQAQQQWLQYGKYMQGMIALALFRTGDVQTARNIIASLKETAIRDEEKGMYWKGMEGGYYWWQAPIETQSLLIEAFHEVANAPKDEAALKTWLLRQKQTHSWSTTRATADACYALLMPAQPRAASSGAQAPSPSSSPDNWLTVERNVDIQAGNKTLSSSQGAEAGTGYFKQVVDGARVQPSMGNITVTMKTSGTSAPSALPAWGAVYWQYFENLDKITAAGNTKAPLRLVKKLFIEKNTDRGPVLEPVQENGVLHPGDKVKVRIELRSDRDLEYVHMKDMRASCMEPVNVLSQYKWQGGLGYYESTKDASTDFFFASLPKGTYVFEYPLFVGQKGNFSNGVTSIECMYAPEFGFHSEGIRVNVEEVTP